MSITEKKGTVIEFLRFLIPKRPDVATLQDKGIIKGNWNAKSSVYILLRVPFFCSFLRKIIKLCLSSFFQMLCLAVRVSQNYVQKRNPQFPSLLLNV